VENGCPITGSRIGKTAIRLPVIAETWNWPACNQVEWRSSCCRSTEAQASLNDLEDIKIPVILAIYSVTLPGL